MKTNNDKGGDRSPKTGSYLKVIRFVVVHVEGSVQLTVSGDGQLFGAGDPIVDGLTRILLHLNIVKLTEIAEPLDELGGNASVELLNLNVENGEHAAALLLADFAEGSVSEAILMFPSPFHLESEVVGATKMVARGTTILTEHSKVYSGQKPHHCPRLTPRKWRSHSLSRIFHGWVIFYLQKNPLLYLQQRAGICLLHGDPLEPES